MPTNYPSGLDSFTTHHDGLGEAILAGDINKIQDAIAAVEAELGLTPKGSSADVAARLASLLKAASNLSDLASASTARTNLGLGTAATISSTAGGDLSGTLPSPTVAKVNGVAVSGTPSSGQIIAATGSTAAAWANPAVIVDGGTPTSTFTPVPIGASYLSTAQIAADPALTGTFVPQPAAAPTRVNQFPKTSALSPLTTTWTTAEAEVARALGWAVVTDPAYGAVADAVVLTDVAMTSGTNVVTSASANWTTADVNKAIVIMGAGGSGQALVTTITGRASAGQISTADTAFADATVLGGPNVNCVYGTDNTAALNAALAAAQAPGLPTSAVTSRYQPRPTVFVPTGAYLVRTPLNPISATGITVRGAGRVSTWLHGCFAGAMFSLDTYTSTPATAYVGTAPDCVFSGLSMVNQVYVPSTYEGVRIGSAIQDNGSGGVRIDNCNFAGYAYGFNGAYGSDFTQLAHNMQFTSCDVGAYFGPGSQQVSVQEADFYNCREGLVVEGAPQGQVRAVSFEDPLVAAIVFEAKSSGTTRSGVSVNLSGAAYSDSWVISGWFESNAAVTNRLAPRMIWIKGDSSGAANRGTGLVVRDSYLISGGTQITSGSSSTIGGASTVAAGSTTIPVVANIPVGVYRLETVASGNSELVTVVSITGSSTPYTAHLSSPTTKSHVTGSVVTAGVACFMESDAFNQLNSPMIDNLSIRGNMINGIWSYQGTNSTSSPVITNTLLPAGSNVNYNVGGPAGSAHYSYATVWQTGITYKQNSQTVPAVTLMAFNSNGVGSANPLLKVRWSDTGTFLSGIAQGGAFVSAYKAQTLVADGAVTIDSSFTNIADVTLSANATSSTITNPTAAGQELTIRWKQDGTGGRTYAWPSNCKFAGGAAPAASTTAGYTDSVTFSYDGTNWSEQSRTLAIR